MNSIDTQSVTEEDDGMNQRVVNLEEIAKDTAKRLGGLESGMAALTQNVAALTQSVSSLTQDVAALTQKVTKLEFDVGIIQAAYVTKEEFQKGLHAMTWKIIGAITLLTAAVSYLSRYNAVSYPQPVPAVSVAPAASTQATPPRTP